MRRLIPILLLLGVSASAAAQSLGEVAARTNKERKGKGASDHAPVILDLT